MPVVILYAFPFVILFQSGELLSVGDVIDRQMNERRPVIYGASYSTRTFQVQFKLQQVIRRAPSVLVIGASRVLQFRSAFFKNPSSFYNQGWGITGVEDIQTLLEAIPKEKSPRILILGLEEFYFNPNYVKSGNFSLVEDGSGANVVASQWWVVLRDYFKHEFSLAQLFRKDTSGISYIGMHAIVSHEGYRKDGSYCYDKVVRTNGRDIQFKSTLDEMANEGPTFERGSHVSPTVLAALDRLLQLCQQRNIHVVAFLPPYPHLIYSKLSSMRDKYGYMFEIASRCAPLFRKYGGSFYDFSDLLSVGASDHELVDGMHGSEKAYLRLFLLMQAQDPLLHAVAADEDYLNRRLNGAVGPYVVFGDDE